MKMLVRVTFFFLLVGAVFAENWGVNTKGEGWNRRALATLYAHNSEWQTQWAWEAFARCQIEGNEKILDFGCGDGKLSALISFMVPNGSVLGVDLSSEMVRFSQKHFPQTLYPNLKFQESPDLDFSTL